MNKEDYSAQQGAFLQANQDMTASEAEWNSIQSPKHPPIRSAGFYRESGAPEWWQLWLLGDVTKTNAPR